MKNNPLGRGLSSLLREEVVPANISNSETVVDISLIEANEEQPRKHFDEIKIRELADSISIHGLVQPIVVTKKPGNMYNIVAGERRFRACKLAGLKEVPIIVKNLTDKEILEISLIENIQRQDLTAIEEANGFQKLIDDYGYSIAQIGNAVSKSRSHVANLLRLNQLPDSIKEMISDGRLTMGHARCLIGLENAEQLAEKILTNDLNVRQTEELVNNKRKKLSKEQNLDSDTNHTEDDMIILAQSLTEKFGVKVTIESFGSGGKISFHYCNMEELDSILASIN